MQRIAQIIFLLLFVSEAAFAEIYFWPVIMKGRGERNEDQSMELKVNSWPTFGASYTFDRWIVSIERSLYENESDNGNVSIEITYTDFSAWVGYELFQAPMAKIYITAGTGIYQQEVQTTASGVVSAETSNDRSLVGFGGEYLLQTPFKFALATGARLFWSQDLEPEIMPEAYLKLGLSF